MVQVAIGGRLDRPSTHPRWWSGRLGWRLGAELVVLGALFLLYRWVRVLVRDQEVAAFANLERVLDLERAIGLDVELAVNRWYAGIEPLAWLGNRFYVFGHFQVMLVTLVWLYLRHPDVYRPFRNLLVGASALGMVVHGAFPLAPPRLRADLGYVDTLAELGPAVYAKGSITADQANHIAAMPSLHAGWALLVALGVVAACRSRHRWWALAHPVAMTVVIVATANHWWLDAVGGFAVVAIVALHPAARPWATGRSGPGEERDDRGHRLAVEPVGRDVRHPELVP